MQQHLTDDEIERLDAFLMSEGAPEDCMLISDLDGFLTAVAVGPEEVGAEEWLPVVWGEDEPEFADPDEAKRMTALMLRRVAQIREQVASAPDAYAPWFWADEDDNPVAVAWAEGFLAGVGLRPDAWQPLLDSDEGLQLVGPIALFWPNEDGNLPSDDEAELEELQLQMAELIPDAVIGIARHWATARLH
ncbi:MAG: UPF0149 family protein [Alphaproteobacteria bacterium]